MVRRSSVSWALVLLLAVLSGCQAILQFDEDKLDTTSGSGGGGTAGSTTSPTVGGGGGTAGSTTQGGGGTGGHTGGSSTTTGTGGSGGGPECSAPEDCPDTGSECVSRTCDNQVCGTTNVADGVEVAGQTDGDCKLAVCDGAGGIKNVDDDADVLDDGQDCTLDTCNAGNPESMPATAGTDCDDAGGSVCDGLGACVQCNMDAECMAPTPKCSAHVCVPAGCNDGVKNGGETDTDCGGPCGATCATGDTCAMAGDCIDGVCNGTCAAAACNDNVKNGVETDKDCGGNSGCAKCGPMKSCNANGDCAGNQCSGAGGVCIPNCADGVKNNTETGVDCGGGTCSGCGVGGPCGQDNDCMATAYCDVAGSCATKKTNGTACVGNNQCGSGNCVDGVCCDVACNGTCLACNLAGSVGSCSFIAAGQDPVDECAGATLVCDGGGGCKKSNGQTCASGGECALALCVDGRCCNSACNGTCIACNVAGSLGTCTNIPNGTDPANECAGAVNCNGNGACGSLLGNGTACSIGTECQSGNCIDGVCCNSTCSGTCLACNVAGSAGTCTNVPNNTDPANECANGACNGAGVCKLDNGQTCATASACLSNNCIDGVCCNTSCGTLCQACNVAGSVGTCTNVAAGTDPASECSGVTACNGAGGCTTLTNGTACTLNAECASGICTDGVCCNAACSGTCQACNNAGSVGTCSSIPSGTDPANECAGTAVCNGSGVCKKVNGDTCAAGTDCLSTSCADGVCCNNACSALCQACNNAGSVGTCSNIANGSDPASECAGATTCNGAGACTLLGLGSTCSNNAECGSGFCVDGVCCNSGCGGTCQACNNAGSVGVCSNIANGADPASECFGATTCNGAGGCTLLAQGAACSANGECSTGFCTDGYCCNSTCSGTCKSCDGTWNVSGFGICSNIDCADPNNECAGTAVCTGGGSCGSIMLCL